MFCTNLCTCNDCRNRSGQSQSDVRSDELVKDESEDNSYSGDERTMMQWTMMNLIFVIIIRMMIFYLLELIDVLSDEEDDGDDVEDDKLYFLLTQYKNKI